MIDFAQITTAFTGAQLVVVAFVLMELRALRESTKDLKARAELRDAAMAKIDKRLAHVMGRLNIEDVEGD